MELRGKSVASVVDKLVRKAALAADQGAVLATPVDTGRARASWIVTIGSASGDTTAPVESGERKSGAREAANTQAALDQANITVATRPRGASIFIANNVEYIKHLNDGTSQQAPHGMIQAGVKAAEAAVRGSRILG